MTETEQPNDSKKRFRDLIDGAEELENDKELIKSQLESLGISPEGKLRPESEDQTSKIAPSPQKGSGKKIPPKLTSKRDSESADIGENSGLDETEVLGETPQQPRSPLDDTPPPSLGSTPHTPPPALDARGMPLPRRMDEAVVRELDAGRVNLLYRRKIPRNLWPGGKKLVREDGIVDRDGDVLLKW